jgi:hypothetical protein
MHGRVLYVGDWDAKSSGNGEGAGPFGDVTAGSVETEDGVLSGADEPFPSASDGNAADMI